MGIGCFDSDLDKCSREAEMYYDNYSNGIFDNDFDYLVNYSALEEIENKISEYNNKIRKFNRIRTSDSFKSLKIQRAVSYLNSQLIDLQTFRRTKLQVNRIREASEREVERIQKSTEMINERARILQEQLQYLHRLFPHNYFLPEKKR